MVLFFTEMRYPLPQTNPGVVEVGMLRVSALVIVLALGASCADCGTSPSDDASAPDAAQHDDAARADSAVRDAARIDATVRTDSARTDTARPDSANPDVAQPDSATPDSASADTAAAVDARHEDAAAAEDSAVAEDGAVDDSAVAEDGAVEDSGPPFTSYTEFGGQPYIRGQGSDMYNDSRRWCECQGKTLRDATVFYQGGCGTYTGKWEYNGSCGGHVWDCCDGCWDTVTCWD